MTGAKFANLKLELEEALKARELLAKDVQFYGSNGDFSENAEYQIAKGKLRSLNKKIDEIKSLLSAAFIIEPKINSGKIEIGSSVIVESLGKQSTYQILGSSESNPSAGIISYNSPLGRALIGKSQDQSVVIAVFGKEIVYKIARIF